MKVNLVVHSLDIENMGGVNRVTIDLAHSLLELNFNVTIYSLGKINNLCCEVSEKIQIISLDMLNHSTNQYKGLNKIKWFQKSYQLLINKIYNRSEEVWLVSSPPLNLLFSIIKFKIPNLIVIGCDHTSTIYSKGFLIDQLKYSLLKKINYMIALTTQDQSFYKDKGLKAIYIPNFIDVSKIKKKENQKKYVIFVGRLSEEKQPIEALKIYALSRLWEQGIKFRIFGYGHLEAEVLKFILDNDLQLYVEVITNEMDPENIYQDAYVLLMTSKIEGFGMVLLESISRNIPCIAYDAPYGPRNIIINGINGYLVELGDFSKGAEFLTSHSLREIHKSDISFTLKSFSKKVVIQKWFEVLSNA